MAMINNQKTAIIGSGLTGPLLATFLARRGFQVDLFEKRADPRSENSHSQKSQSKSINLALSARGIYALQQVGLWDAVQPLAIPMHGRMIHNLQGEQSFQPYSSKAEEKIFAVSRHKLSQHLVDLAASQSGIHCYFEHACTAVDLNAGRYTFNAKSGSSEHNYQVIFACDGIHSLVRKAMQQAKAIEVNTKPLGHGYKELYLPPDAQGQFQFEPNALHIWPRKQFMLIALPNLDHSFTCTLFLPHQGEVSFAALDSTEKIDNFFSCYFPDIKQRIPILPEQFNKNPIGKLASVYTQPWYYENHSNCIALLGDAAHAVVPFFGQGMNASFQDCTVLDAILSKNPENWQEVFRQYSAAQVANGHAIADLALENYVEMRDLVQDQDFLALRAFEKVLADWFPERFIPRYAMVSFHRIPYAEVVRRGELQTQLIRELQTQYGSAENLCRQNIAPKVQACLKLIFTGT